MPCQMKCRIGHVCLNSLHAVTDGDKQCCCFDSSPFKLKQSSLHLCLPWTCTAAAESSPSPLGTAPLPPVERKRGEKKKAWIDIDIYTYVKAMLCFKILVEMSELLFLYLFLSSARILFLLFLLFVLIILAAGAFFFYFCLPSSRHNKLLLERHGCVQSWSKEQSDIVHIN